MFSEMFEKVHAWKGGLLFFLPELRTLRFIRIHENGSYEILDHRMEHAFLPRERMHVNRWPQDVVVFYNFRNDPCCQQGISYPLPEKGFPLTGRTPCLLDCKCLPNKPLTRCNPPTCFGRMVLNEHQQLVAVKQTMRYQTGLLRRLQPSGPGIRSLFGNCFDQNECREILKRLHEATTQCCRIKVRTDILKHTGHTGCGFRIGSLILTHPDLVPKERCGLATFSFSEHHEAFYPPNDPFLILERPRREWLYGIEFCGKATCHKTIEDELRVMLMHLHQDEMQRLQNSIDTRSVQLMQNASSNSKTDTAIPNATATSAATSATSATDTKSTVETTATTKDYQPILVALSYASLDDRINVTCLDEFVMRKGRFYTSGGNFSPMSRGSVCLWVSPTMYQIAGVLGLPDTENPSMIEVIPFSVQRDDIQKAMYRDKDKPH